MADVTVGEKWNEQWCYKLVRLDMGDSLEDEIERQLNRLGSDGWEAIGLTFAERAWIRILFKKKALPAEASGAK